MELIIAAIGAELKELNKTMHEIADQLASINNTLKENTPPDVAASNGAE